MDPLKRIATRFSPEPTVANTACGVYRLQAATNRRGKRYVLGGAEPSTERRRPGVLITTHKRRIRAMLTRRDYVAADAYYRTVRHFYAQSAYEKVRQYYWQKHRDEVIAELADMLSDFRFKEANELAVGSIVVVEPEEYQNELKRPAIQQFFRETFSFDVNDEQARALACQAQHVLVKARAGTGKTRTIVSKAVLAMREDDLCPDQILMLAFNRDAASEMLNRMRGEFNFTEFTTSKTFHSLAYRIVNPSKAIPSTDDVRLELIEKALRSVWTDAFRRLVNLFFRMAEDTDLLLDKTLDSAAYYKYRRTDLKLLSLNGVRVKSIGEKWIADFLYEHDIVFEYEGFFWWNGQPYRPDFTLKEPEFNYEVIAILEHWGVSARDNEEEVLFDDGMTVGQYRKQIERKRQYWIKKGIMLIETSIDDLRQGREAFEVTLRNRLEGIGIQCERLSDAKLQENLERRYWNELSKLMRQFIDRAKNRRLTPEDAKRIGRAVPKRKMRMRTFWRLASRVFGEYERILLQENKMDFQDLLEEAAERIEAEKGDIVFIPERGKNPVRLDGLRWLLIDEYQDFSPGFDNMVKTMRKYNPRLRLFCVGDDWQTINRFAGSEPVYFRRFTKNIAKAGETLLRINHRSRRRIVESSNRLMEGLGKPGMWLPNMYGGTVSITCVDKLWLEKLPNNGPNGMEAAEEDGEKSRRKFDPGFMRAKSIAICCGLISSRNSSDASVAILSRTNYIYGVSLFDYQKELLKGIETNGTVPDKVNVSTVHKFKGLQADLVILLDVTAGQVPLIHKDNELLAPFLPDGADPFEEALIDERRLFYVALSRATERLWILSESGRLSPFLECLQVPNVHPGAVTPIVCQ